MKEQYAGDIHDYRKYALLRALSKNYRHLGVCWMRTPNDSRTDGNNRRYVENAERWRNYDEGLFDFLTTIQTKSDDSRLSLIEEGGIIPRASYFSDIIPDSPKDRASCLERCEQQFSECDLLFFDPDNGLDVPSKALGHKGSCKYLYREEVQRFYSSGKSLLIYQHFCREKREFFVKRLSNDLMKIAPQSSTKVFKTPHVAFFLIIHPTHKSALSEFSGSGLYSVV
jgi:hypothetical protein